MRVQLAALISEVEVERLQLVAGLAERLSARAWLVGGPVRDALLGRTTLDLDVAVEGDPLPLARALAETLSGNLIVHERFRTAVVEAGEFHFDLATTRIETYPQPGALPVVTPASLDEDLHRRDFTINAIALRLDAGLDTLHDPLGGQDDLTAGVVRGLHPATFRDDPTRIIRAARYAARFGHGLETRTREWLAAAVDESVMGAVTGPRLWGELRRLLLEDTAPAAIELLDEWGALPALGLRLQSAAELRELGRAAATVASPTGAEDRALAALGLLARDIELVADHLALTVPERRGAAAAASAAAVPPACVFAPGAKSSTLYEGLGQLPAAALLALWARHPDCRPALRRLITLGESRADVTGADLRHLGFSPSPGFAHALQAALRAKLDERANPDEQLVAAREALLKWLREDGL